MVTTPLALSEPGFFALSERVPFGGYFCSRPAHISFAAFSRLSNSSPALGRCTRHVLPRGMRRVMIVLLAFSAAEALLLTPPVQRLSAGALTPRIAAASTMQLDVIPLCDSTSPGFIASRFVMPAVGGSVLAGLVRRPVTKLVVGVAALLSVVVLCSPLRGRTSLQPRRAPRAPGATS